MGVSEMYSGLAVREVSWLSAVWESSSIHTYPRVLRCLGAAFRAGFRTRFVVFALDDLLLALLVAFLAREVFVALVATAGVEGAPERVFMVVMTTRAVCIGEDECLW